MRVVTINRFILINEFTKKLYFINNKTTASIKSFVTFLKSLLFSIAMVLFFSSCEDKSINKEIERLQSLEQEFNKTISENNIERAKLICIQMKWEYVATTAGADAKCKKLADIWDDKRRNYLKIIGLDPIEILGEKPKPKTLKEKLIESY
jgi:hypothetical protein